MLLTASLVLMVSGSLRDLITPAGYWAAWGAWAVAAFIAARPVDGRPAAPGLPAWITASCAVLWLGMIIAAAINRDWVSAYQAMKIAVITGMFLVMWRLAARLDWRRLVVAMSWAVGVMLVSLAVSKVWSPTGQALYEVSREGSFLAVYGVLWKAGAFFLPVFLADAIVSPRAWARNSLMVAACIFLVLIDGSRTGLLLLAATAIGFFAFVLWRGDGGLLRRRVRWICGTLALLLLLQLLNTGANLGMIRLWTAGTPPAVSPAAAPATAPTPAPAPAPEIQPGQVLEGALNRTFETRIGAGDPARVKLLRASLGQVGGCLPLGCGFGAMGTEIGTAWMVVHNAYLAALGDFGVLGLAGMLGFLAAAWLPIQRVLRRGRAAANGYFIVASAGSALAYGMALMLNTFTTEMSEWGYLVLMLAFAWMPAGDD